jgi:hypothetical protein
MGPISVVTIPAITNPPWRTTGATEEVGSEAGRVGIELMLKAFCRNGCRGHFLHNPELGQMVVMVILQSMVS